MRSFALGGLASVLVACGPPTSQLDLRLTVLDRGLGGRPRAPAAEPGAPPADIDAFRLCVQRPEGKAEACKSFTNLTAGRYRIDGLPTGEHWVVTFQGTHSADPQTAIWCGRATGVTIADDQTTQVQMLLSRCGDFSRTVEQPTLARVFHSASLRFDSRVLVAGGYESYEPTTGCDRPCVGFTATDAVGIYNHRDGTFSRAQGGLTHTRGLHAAAVLSDGRLLVAGGCEVASLQSEFSDDDRPGSPLRCLVPGQAAGTVEVYDPANGTSQTSDIPPTVFAAGVSVGDDELLLLGGEDDRGVPLRRAVRIAVQGDQIQVFPIEQALAVARRAPTAVVFSRPEEEPLEILVVGGVEAVDKTNAGIYAERLFYQDGNLVNHVPRFVEEMPAQGLPVAHAAGSRAGPGWVLVCGGAHPARFLSDASPFQPQPLTTGAIFDLRVESMQALDADAQLLEGRFLHTATAVDRLGNALVVGGFTARQAERPLGYAAGARSEWWDEQAGYFSLRWVAGEPVQMEVPRAGHTATLLPDGNVLLIGGTDGTEILRVAELFNPAPTTLEMDGLPPL